MAVAQLVIQIKRKTDGGAALSCRRVDGSFTWQRQAGQQGRFFPLHDLTHYAVETVLHHPRGFYGLVAEGWNLTDFGKPWPRGPLPIEALASELLVGFLDGERGVSGAPVVSDDDLRKVRDKRRELFARWAALPAGEALELTFP